MGLILDTSETCEFAVELRKESVQLYGVDEDDSIEIELDDLPEFIDVLRTALSMAGGK